MTDRQPGSPAAHRPAARQPTDRQPTDRQPRSPAAPQPRSPAAPQPRSPAARQPGSPPTGSPAARQPTDRQPRSPAAHRHEKGPHSYEWGPRFSRRLSLFPLPFARQFSCSPRDPSSRRFRRRILTMTENHSLSKWQAPVPWHVFWYQRARTILTALMRGINE
jgi:hypothetical protein